MTATDGANLIAAERQRQIQVEGWTPEHDDKHRPGELAAAAVSYIFPADSAWYWPWDEPFKLSDDPIRNLVKAGALIAAEIDRLTRAAEGTE
jgi:hypothetical protein